MKATCSVDGCTKDRKPRHSKCSMHVARLARHGDIDHVTPRRKGDPSERFWAKVDIKGPDDCWIYLGTLVRGYGQFTAGRGFRVRAHRFAYTEKVGPIPEGLTLDHLCCVTACVNPSHLEPVTASENVRRYHLREKGLL